MKARLLKILINLQLQFVSQPVLSSCGICTNVKIAVHNDRDTALFASMMRELFYQWPEFSGDPWYPVPDPTGDLSADDAFCQIVEKWTGPYGESRIRLLNFMIEELSK